MLGNFDKCLAFTLVAEGGFSDNPKDPGGATEHGITLNTLADWREQHSEPSPPLADLQNISADEVRAIYGAEYWNRINGDQLPAGVDLMVFDFGVTSAPARSARLLQIVLRAPVIADSWIGPQTIMAVNTLCVAGAPELIEYLYTAQCNFYKSLSAFATFGAGWMNRLDKRKALALTMRSTNI